MAAYKLSRSHNDFLYRWTEQGITVAVQSVRETARGVEGELLVTGANGAAEHLVGPLGVTLTGDRSRLVRVLTDAGMEQDTARVVVETCYTSTVDAFRAGEPVVDIATVQAPARTNYLLTGLLPEGQTTILYGDGGTGKSTLAVACALSVVCCEPLVPRWRLGAMPGGVLYLDWETSEQDMARVVSGLMRGYDLMPPEGSINYLPMSRPLVDDIRRVREEVSARDVVLVIVDSLGFAAGEEPESNKSATRMMNALRSLGPGVTKLCIGHVSKAGAAMKGRQRTFGGVYLENGARAVWEIRRAGEQAAQGGQSGDDEPEQGQDAGDDGPPLNVPIRVGLYHRKANQGPLQRPMALRIEYDLSGAPSRIHSDVMRGGDELSGALPLGQRIVLALKEHPKVPVIRLAELTEAPVEQVRVSLSRLGQQVISFNEEWKDGERRARTVWALRARE